MDARLDFQPEGSRWTLFIAGDCCLDPAVRPPGTESSLLSPGLADRVGRADVALANLEAPVRSSDSTPVPKSGPALENDPTAPTRLADAGFDGVTLANNHAMDYGWESLQATRTDCESVGLSTCGAGTDRRHALHPATFEVSGTDVAVVSVCEREFGVDDADRPGTAWAGHPDTLERVRPVATTYDAVVVVAHGGVEYVPFPSPERRDSLRAFVDAGADAVVSHHPHVPQGWETYDGAPIFYSLGNFVFDKMADDDATRWGLAVELEFAGSTPVGATLVPTALVDSVVEPLEAVDSGTHDDRLEYLHHLSKLTATDLDAHWQAVAVRLFYRTYSTWLSTGFGDDVDRFSVARENPFDPSVHQELWDVTEEERREEMLVMLNVLRYEGHRRVTTDALAVLTGETEDRRTPEVEAMVENLLAQTRRG